MLMIRENRMLVKQTGLDNQDILQHFKQRLLDMPLMVEVAQLVIDCLSKKVMVWLLSITRAKKLIIFQKDKIQDRWLLLWMTMEMMEKRQEKRKNLRRVLMTSSSSRMTTLSRRTPILETQTLMSTRNLHLMNREKGWSGMPFPLFQEEPTIMMTSAMILLSVWCPSTIWQWVWNWIWER